MGVEARIFSGISQTLASGSSDFTMRIWESLSVQERSKRELVT
jgi:WD40 repeat protein